MTKFAKREYTLELITPAFLGGYDQSAEWRTAGMKALIRQWWRVVYVAEHGVNVAEMRKAEGLRFGVAAGPKDSHKAAVQIRFDEPPKAPSAIVSGIRGDRSNALQYLGFGPFVQVDRPSSRLALTAGSSSKIKFKIILKALNEQQLQQYKHEIDQTMGLVHQFGTLGSRASNGWGSVHVSGDLKSDLDLRQYTKTFQACMTADWKQAIASDSSGLMLWQSKPYADWESAMRVLKTVRKEDQNSLAKSMGLRPVINGPTLKPRNDHRWPNQFSFKVIKQGTQFLGQVCLFAHRWHDSNDQRLDRLLQDVAEQLDQSSLFKRI